jgi:hypothetical protein
MHKLFILIPNPCTKSRYAKITQFLPYHLTERFKILEKMKIIPGYKFFKRDKTTIKDLKYIKNKSNNYAHIKHKIIRQFIHNLNLNFNKNKQRKTNRRKT